MKVIQIVDSLGQGGGVGSFVYDMCLALKKRGVDISLIGILENKEGLQIQELRKNGIPVYCMNAPSKVSAIAFYIPKLKVMIRNIAGNCKTVCNLHLKLSVLMGAVATIGLKKVRCIETYHNTYHRYHLQFFLLQSRIKKYIAVSYAAQEEMYNRFHAPREKVLAVPNCVDREKLRIGIKSSYIAHDFISIVSVGRLSYEKNLQISVGALAKICDEQVRYTVVGDGPDRDKVHAAANGNQYIHFMGSVSREEVLQILANADLVIMPSLWEGRSILQLEALAFDTPLVISDVPGLREPFGEKSLNEDEKWRRCSFGYLVNTNDESAYNSAVADFKKHPELVESMQKRVREVSKENDIEVMLDKYMKIYCDVLV